MQTLGLAGWSGSGKTTLLVALVADLSARGLRVSTMKHAHHGFDVDQPGKDSFRHRAAGAVEVMIASGARWALMHELRGSPEPASVDLRRHMTPVDLLLIEGFKAEPHPKLEVHRPSLGRPLLSTDDPSFIAVASDADISGLAIPRLDLDDPAAIADFIVGRFDLVPLSASAG